MAKQFNSIALCSWPLLSFLLWDYDVIKHAIMKRVCYGDNTRCPINAALFQFIALLLEGRKVMYCMCKVSNYSVND